MKKIFIVLVSIFIVRVSAFSQTPVSERLIGLDALDFNINRPINKGLGYRACHNIDNIYKILNNIDLAAYLDVENDNNYELAIYNCYFDKHPLYDENPVKVLNVNFFVKYSESKIYGIHVELDKKTKEVAYFYSFPVNYIGTNKKQQSIATEINTYIKLYNGTIEPIAFTTETYSYVSFIDTSLNYSAEFKNVICKYTSELYGTHYVLIRYTTDKIPNYNKWIRSEIRVSSFR